ncbi:conserved Plasmodium protein, unknown function [Plasmodium vinckei lentum]|uniref:Uncharacterized protein n=1 Tax=Plasmodium vinckei lentum TaxID=138297 RepID=A0A6V7SLV8_PLAVN|nr:conserved Plasmodium protein, unknown function [Plasmodium vinckei lentum]
MIEYALNIPKETKKKKEKKQYDNIVSSALDYYKNFNNPNCKEKCNGSTISHISTENLDPEQKEPLRSLNNLDVCKKNENNKSNTFNEQNENRNDVIFLIEKQLCLQNDLLKENILAKLKININEYLYNVKDKICNEILLAGDKRKLLKKYIYELQCNNFEVLKNIFCLFNSNNEYNDYAFNEMFHTLLLCFNKKDEQNILIIIYIFITLLNQNNINKSYTHILDALITILNADQCKLPLYQKDDTTRLFDHKPMVLTNQSISEYCRYFLFVYFFYLMRLISNYQMRIHLDKIIKVCLVGLFDNCCEINFLIMNFIEEIIDKIEECYINYHYIISTSLLKCLCNKNSKIKIKCMHTLVKIIKNNNNNTQNYKIIEMLIGYKDPNIVPIKCFYDNNYVNINYLCLLYNDKSIKVKYNFYSFIFIILYEFIDSNDFTTFLLPYLFSACFDNYKIFRFLSFIYIQVLSKRKKLGSTCTDTTSCNNNFQKNMNEEEIYEFFPEWSYKTPFTLPLPLTEYYFPQTHNNPFIIKKDYYKINLHIYYDNINKQETSNNFYFDEEKNETHPVCKESDNNKKIKYDDLEIEMSVPNKVDDYDEYHNYEKTINQFINSHPYISNILRENKIKDIDITYNKMRKETKELSFTILNTYFKHLYKNQDDETNKSQFLESSKIILLIFYFIEDNVTEHIPQFFSYLFNSFDKKIDPQQLDIYINSLYLIGSYVNPSNYYLFIENYLNNTTGNNYKHVTLICLYILYFTFLGTIETYINIKKCGLSQSDIHPSFIMVIKKVTNFFFLIISRDEYPEKYILILQIIYLLFKNEEVYTKIEEKSMTQLIILLYIIFKKTKHIRINLPKGKDHMCIYKNFDISIDIFDLHFYLTRLKSFKKFEGVNFDKESLNIQLSSEIIYEVFKLFDENINQQKIILDMLSDDILYNPYYVYYLIKYIIKKQTFFYDSNLSLFLCNIIIKILNMNQNEKNIMKVLLHNENLELNDIHQETIKKNKNKVRHVFLEHSCTIFLLFIFKNINIYESFDNIIDTCKIIYYLLSEIKNPYSFLYFVKRTCLVHKLLDILECREVKSLYFCKYIMNNIYLEYGKYINNDGDCRYLDNINIKKKIEIRNRVNYEVNVLYYFISCCIYLIYYKSLCCISIIANDCTEKNNEIKLNEFFNNIFQNTNKRLLNVLKIGEKNNNTFLNTYKNNVIDILKNKNYMELFLLRNNILKENEYNNLILNIHIYFRHTYDFLQNINTFILNPVIINYFYGVSKEHICTEQIINDIILDTKDTNENANKNASENTKDTVKESTHEANLINSIESYFISDDINDIALIQYDTSNFCSYLKNHDIALILLRNDIYNIPFRTLENKSIIILLYSYILFFSDNFFIPNLTKNVNTPVLSNLNFGLVDDFFLNASKIHTTHVTGIFNVLILLYLENENDLKNSLKKKKRFTYFEKLNNLDKNTFSSILNNIISSYENQDTEKKALKNCINFLLNNLSTPYLDILTNLRDTYTRTKHVKRLDVCNYIINTFS